MTSQPSSDPDALPEARWPDAIDEILRGDLTVALATVTPALGVVLAPMANIGLGNRARQTVTLTSSLGLWRKLRRIEDNPRVALAFHTREQSSSDRSEYVLIQGSASFSWTPDHAWLESIGESWDRRLEPRTMGPLWDRWLRVYHWERVGIEVRAVRVVVWPNLTCTGAPQTFGAPLPGNPAPQRLPTRGTAPRIDHFRAATKMRRLPHVLLGWVGADGFPVAVPVKVGPAHERGILLELPDGVLPPSGRRAGLCAHWFTAQVTGEEQRLYTGWLTPASGNHALYAPHTERGYRLPGSKLAYRVAVGMATQLGYRRARRAGVLGEREANYE